MGGWKHKVVRFADGTQAVQQQPGGVWVAVVEATGEEAPVGSEAEVYIRARNTATEEPHSNS